MQMVSLATIALIFVAPAAHAGLWDKMKSSAATCSDNLGKVGSALNEKSKEMSRLHALIEMQVRELSAGMSALSRQLCELGYQGKDCGAAAVTALVGEAVPMVVRIVRFDGELADVKDGILLPLISRLQDIRDARDQRLAIDVLASRLTRLALFTVEVGLKLPKFAPNAAEATVTGALGGVMTGLALQNPILAPIVAQLIDQAQAGGETVGRDLVANFIGAVVTNLKAAMTEPGLTLGQRLDRLVCLEDILIEWFTKIGQAVGWGDLETELAAWRNSHR